MTTDLTQRRCCSHKPIRCRVQVDVTDDNRIQSRVRKGCVNTNQIDLNKYNVTKWSILRRTVCVRTCQTIGRETPLFSCEPTRVNVHVVNVHVAFTWASFHLVMVEVICYVFWRNRLFPPDPSWKRTTLINTWFRQDSPLGHLSAAADWTPVTGASPHSSLINTY